MNLKREAWEDWYRNAWTTSSPPQAELSSNEIVKWMSEFGDKAVWSKGTDIRAGHWTIYSEELPYPVTGRTFGEAICKAAALMEEQS